MHGSRDTSPTLNLGNVGAGYGELKSRTLDFTTRADVSFTPTLSLQFYVQPFITIGDYTNFKELVEPKSYQFKPYPLNENLDFHRRSLRSNTVLRWEFRPGSTLFLVWSPSREAALESVTEADLEFRPLYRLGSSFTDAGKTSFSSNVGIGLGCDEVKRIP